MKLRLGKSIPKLIFGILLAAAIIGCASCNGSSLQAVFILCCAAVLASLLQVEIRQPKLLRWIYGMAFLAVPFATFFIGQILQNVGLLSVVPLRIVLNVIIILILQLTVLIISNSPRLSMTIGCAAPTILVLFNAYLYIFRGNALTPSDLLSIKTAVSFVDDYSLLPNAPMLYGLALTGILILSVWCLPEIQPKCHFFRHAATIAAFTFALLIAGSQLSAYYWENTGAHYNGFLLNFFLQGKTVFISEPDGYQNNTIQALEHRYAQESKSDSSTPDIIVIMNESFADLEVFKNDLSTNQEVTPFIDSLQENTVRGYLYGSVFGGSTANSEYEFLTGNSMAFFPQGSIVYQQYIQDDPYSLLSVLKHMGYKCVAMHPFRKEGWMRNTVYPTLGFDEAYFLEDFPQDHLIREYVSDQSMFSYLIDYHNRHEENTPLFLFGITIQNHGGYTDADYESQILLEGYSAAYPEAEQYLSLIHETDKAVQQLISYYSAVQRDVVILFFGDHMPKIENAFYEELNGGPFDTLDSQMLKQKVPFFIWTNYSIEDQTIPCSSINYLPVYLLNAAGISLPPYFQFLEETNSVIPAINALGFYSPAAGRFLPLNQAGNPEAEAIQNYHILQYNNVFDTKNRSVQFFKP